MSDYPNVRLMVSHERFYSQNEADKELRALLVIADQTERLMDIIRMFHDPDGCRYPTVSCTVCAALSRANIEGVADS